MPNTRRSTCTANSGEARYVAVNGFIRAGQYPATCLQPVLQCLGLEAQAQPADPSLGEWRGLRELVPYRESEYNRLQRGPCLVRLAQGVTGFLIQTESWKTSARGGRSERSST
jgi:hypothetical protein